MRWFEFSSTCQCGETDFGYIPSEERYNMRCFVCNRYQLPLLFKRFDDDITYEEYLDEVYEEEEDDEDEDFDWEFEPEESLKKGF